MKGITLFYFICIFKIICVNAYCNINIDITNGIKYNNGSVLHDDILYLSEHVFEEENKLKGCVCNYKACIQKCCLKDQHFGIEGTKKCVDGNRNMDIPIHDKENVMEEETFHLIEAPPKWCTGTKYLLEPDEYMEDIWKVQKGGHIYKPNDAADMQTIEALKFCIEHVENQNLTVIVCQTEVEKANEESMVHAIGIYYLILSYLVQIIIS